MDSVTADRRQSGRADDAEHDNVAIVDAHRTFLATLVSAVVFISIVITFIL